MQHSDQEVKKLERKERKQKRKLARMLKRAGIAQEQIDEMKNDGVAVSLNLTSEQVALLTSPRKRLYGAESDFAKVIINEVLSVCVTSPQYALALLFQLCSLPV